MWDLLMNSLWYLGLGVGAIMAIFLSILFGLSFLCYFFKVGEKVLISLKILEGLDEFQKSKIKK